MTARALFGQCFNVLQTFEEDRPEAVLCWACECGEGRRARGLQPGDVSLCRKQAGPGEIILHSHVTLAVPESVLVSFFRDQGHMPSHLFRSGASIPTSFWAAGLRPTMIARGLAPVTVSTCASPFTATRAIGGVLSRPRILVDPRFCPLPIELRHASGIDSHPWRLRFAICTERPRPCDSESCTDCASRRLLLGTPGCRRQCAALGAPHWNTSGSLGPHA
jgi:hypothetical protein